MGFFSCNGEGAVSACDPSYWDCKKISPMSATADGELKIRKFRYADIITATDGFSSANFLGKGSHGTVYRAVLDDGKLVAAVKRTKVGSSFGSSPSENEAGILSRIRNRRLVNLIGFCDDATDGRLLLVVEYMPNGSFHELLHGSHDPPGLVRRVRLALQVAKAVRWLHSLEPSVIHRDIKSCNVLIDEKQNARLGDFGLALRGHAEDARATRTPPAGTLGYLDPSYLAPGDLSTKSDVFSFGILLLEILSGRNAIDVNYSPPSVVDWAVPLIRRREFEVVCDERMDFPVDGSVLRDIALVAARCVRTTVRKRPEMAEVVEALKGISRRVDAMRVLGGLRRRGHGPRPRVKQNEETIEFTSPSRFGESEQRLVNFSSPSKIRIMGMVRSKSVGSSREWEPRKTELAGVGNNNRRRSVVVGKWPAARLIKSRSMGDHVQDNPPNHDHDAGKLIGGWDDEEDKLLERPLVLLSLQPS